MPEQSRKFLIIDANAIIHRAYHALPPLKTKQGELVNAVYGFCLIFLKAIAEIKPYFAAAAFDVAEPTFRHKEFKEYKAKRKKAPDELYQQIAGVKKALLAFNVPIFEKPGFEADDLIGALARKAEKTQVLPKVENIILTGDLDALQLVNEQTKVYTMKKGIKDTALYDIDKVKERYDGLLPEQLTDFRALRGDPSDNIPGVTGIGEKTAISLLKDFKTLENLYEEIEKQSKKANKIKKAVLEKLKQYKDQAFVSQHLAEIQINMDIDFKLKDLEFSFTEEQVKKTFEKFEFYALLKRLPGSSDKNKEEQNTKTTSSLFTSAGKAKKEKQNPQKPNNQKQEIEQLYKQDILSEKLFQLETELAPLVERMEKNGIKVDEEYLKELSLKLGKKINLLENKAFKIAGKQFNLNSPQQVSEVLFSKLKIPVTGLKKTPTGAVSTNAEQLEKIKHPIIDVLLEQRELFKLKTGFVDALPKMIAQDGRIHPSFHQLGAETGRMSCSNPNLQNVPVKTELGREIRRAFLAEKGFQFLSADYSQIELRIAASLSEDEKMLGFFKQGKDIHTMTASKVFEIPESKVKKEQRKLAKALNFGIIYGMGPHKFAQTTGISFREAKEFIQKYFAEFHQLSDYLDKLIEQAKEHGFSQTALGRKRFLPEIDSRDPRLKAQAERVARNLPMQGYSADIIKLAMVQLAQEKVLDKDCCLLLQIHDELLFEIRKEKTQEKARKIKAIMEKPVNLQAGLVVEIKTGPTWGSLKNIVK